jgi:hypothetical protein
MADSRPRIEIEAKFFQDSARHIGFGFAALWLALVALIGPAAAQQTLSFESYLGIVPAEIVRGYAPERPESMMHRGVPQQGRHEYHVMVAIFDGATGGRISDAAVTAQAPALGVFGPRKKLEPMELAGAMTYGNFFDLPGADLHTVGLEVRREPSRLPVTFDSSTITATTDKEFAGH